MTRLNSKAKAGFYPTPPEMTRLIASCLKAPCNEAWRALDPCAGEGTALATLAVSFNRKATTYGIELDKNRAEKAEKVLDHVLNASYEAIRIFANSFGLLWLNPPYDSDVTQPGRRLEYAFLKRCSNWLVPEGVLVYIIPDYQITPKIASLLSSRFENVSVHRFPDPHYARFRQCVIFGVKRNREVIDEAAAFRIGKCAEGIGQPLTERGVVHSIPSTEEGKDNFQFYLADVEPEEILKEARAMGVWTVPEFRDALSPRVETSIEPLLPLRKGHIAMLLAAGCLGNALLEKDGRRVVVKGQLEKRSLDKSSAEERETGITRTIETFIATIEVLELHTGVITRIEEDSLRSWFGEWKDALLSYLAEHARPFHDGELGAFAHTLHSLSRNRRLPGRNTTGLFEAQKHTSAAVARYLSSRGGSAIVQATMGTGKTTMAIAIAELLRKRRAA